MENEGLLIVPFNIGLDNGIYELYEYEINIFLNEPSFEDLIKRVYTGNDMSTVSKEDIEFKINIYAVYKTEDDMNGKNKNIL